MSRVRAGAVPPLAGGYITRAEINSALAEALGPGLTAALTPSRAPGAPGILRDWRSASGKTQAAVAYAEELWASESIDILVWVTATSQPAVLSTLAEAAVALRTAGVQATGPDAAGGGHRATGQQALTRPSPPASWHGSARPRGHGSSCSTTSRTRR